VARFGPIRGICVPTDFDLQVLESRSVVGFEQIIQNLAALRFRIVDEESRRRSGADPSNSFKYSSFSRAIYLDVSFLEWILAGYERCEYKRECEYEG